jgi:hypothetical protein
MKTQSTRTFGIAKAVLRGKYVTLSTYVKKYREIANK